MPKELFSTPEDKQSPPRKVSTPPPAPVVKAADDIEDEFHPENLRLLNTMDLTDLVTSELVGLPARKPKKDEWFRVHPGHQQQGGILEIESEKKVFWVSPGVQAQVQEDPCFSLRLCVLCVNRQGVPFIWPVKPGVAAGSKGYKWVWIPFSAMLFGKEKWTRLYWSHEKQEHIVETSGLLDAPKFPEKPFPELLRLAFKDAVISTVDHPAILRLKGRDK